MALTKLIPFAVLAGLALALALSSALCTALATAPALTDLSARILQVTR